MTLAFDNVDLDADLATSENGKKEGQVRPMGQWPQSLNINGPFLKSMGHWSKLMGWSFFPVIPELVITRGLLGTIAFSKVISHWEPCSEAVVWGERGLRVQDYCEIRERFWNCVN